MKIELIYEWLGNQPGVTLDLIPQKAFELVQRGAARFVDRPVVHPVTGRAYEESGAEETSGTVEQEAEATEVEQDEEVSEEEIEEKAVEKSSKDKMVRRGTAVSVKQGAAK